MKFDNQTLGRLEKLFDLQMWAFGCDARRPEGNLFAARGMRPTPPPPGSALSSTWRETLGAFAIELSSAGVTLGEGSKQLTLRRGPLGPQLRGAAVELLPALAAWVLTWEAWVDAQVGSEWRQTTLALRRRPSPWSVAGLREQWLELKDRGATLGATSGERLGSLGSPCAQLPCSHS
jgi:hypothetical protein